MIEGQMHGSARKLRWALLGGALLLLCVLAAVFGLARYRAGQIWQRILARNGVNLSRQTSGFTYSQSSGGRTVFTLHASKASPEGKNRWALQDAVLILYGQKTGREDRVYGKQFTYDQNEGVARAIGEVHMDLQAPDAVGKAASGGAYPELGFGPGNEVSTPSGVIHVRTSGLVYVRKLGLAATGETTEFRYGGITCVSRGAEFDSGPSVVRLLADVRMTGTLRRSPFTLIAAHAELNRAANTADLTDASLKTADQEARAAHAVLHLREGGALQAAEASGNVEARAGTQTIAAPQLAATFAAENRPQHAQWSGGVHFADTDGTRPAQGGARTLTLLWAPDGSVQQATAAGDAQYATRALAANSAAVSRRLRADQIEASFVPKGATSQRHGAVLRQVHMTGGAKVDTVTEAAAAKAVGQASTTQVSADELTTMFRGAETGTPEPAQLHGVGHTRLEQVASDGARQSSEGQTLDVLFAPGSNGKAGTSQVDSAVQVGEVLVHNWPAPKAQTVAGTAAATVPSPSTGKAARAVFSQAEDTLTLEGSESAQASVEQGGGNLAAAQIVLHQNTGDAEASGGVVATDRAQGSSSTPGRAPGATHVLASRARLLRTAGLSEFFGDAGHPAQLWQEGSQVKAAEITLNNKTKGVIATPGPAGGLVDAVFSDTEPQPASTNPGKRAPAVERTRAGDRTQAKSTEAGRSAVQVSAARMDFDDARHEAVFTGPVHMRGAMGEASADRGTAFLRSGTATGPPATHRQETTGGAALGGALDRMVLQGAVHLTEPGRTGRGEQLTYIAATDSFVLTGTVAKPPEVTGEQGTRVTGATLLFRSRESTIVVSGGAKNNVQAGGPARVHTETDLKP